MSAPPQALPTQPPGYWKVVGLLLVASYRRAVGRQRRQRALFRQRAGKQTNFAQLGVVLSAVFLALLHILVAFAVAGGVAAGVQVTAERNGLIQVDPWFIQGVAHPERLHWGHGVTLGAQRSLNRAYHVEASQIAQRDGGDRRDLEALLRQAVAQHGQAGLVARPALIPGMRNLAQAGPLAGLLGSLTLLIWFVMMAFQGEGLELDINRRRHPMWEWLFSHPVPQGAVFLADMLAPMAANPIYFGAPLLPGLLFGFIYGPAIGFLAALLVGIPVTLAASCLGKALEIAVTLRFAPRSRGAMIGLMGWLGYATMLGLILIAITGNKAFVVLAGLLAPLSSISWPYLGWFLGLLPDGSFSMPAGILADMFAAALVIAVSVRFSVWGAARGLTATQDAGWATAPQALRPSVTFGKDALYRKELLWFRRDRSALVQAVLIPLSMAGLQMFNLRGILVHAGHQWNALCGAGIVFGTYFLLVLGPKSLASEGAALWISLTWPQGLEKLLQAKARLWTLLATGIVGSVLVFAAFRFPANAWRIALLGIAWYFFARSMAAKTVTLANVTSESGEFQRAPASRRWAAQLGLLTFSIGVITQQWNLVVMGVVYSAVTAAAMWQNFRARLPYLYDVWSEVLPTPPTLMHAMIGISLLVEIGATIGGIMMVFLPRGLVAMANAGIYGVCAAAVSLGMARFLQNRDVPQRDIWNWRDAAAPQSGSVGWRIGPPGRMGWRASLLLGLAIGGALGTLALGYQAILTHIPYAADQLQKSSVLMQSVPYFHASLFVMAVLIAPFAEEFLFRGLLYRALDKEWGGWRAVLGSAAFFAVYHPMLAWAPVFLLGIVNALLFRKTGRLATAVLLHMTYNAIVLT